MSIDQKILAVLDTKGGFTTAHVAKTIGPDLGMSYRRWCARVRQELESLCARGLVRQLDNLKPIAWVKTEKETA
ncbi:hypothetical protein [Comamonas antarctica]|uniref:hypothetical protein n=1 Tax=Comamonas antarctica TaxID=2743470 RepID=UPI0028EC0F36|nr:hypothetical protein [Comamonas antarctica]